VGKAMPALQPERSARDLIDRAIGENRNNERLLYVFSAIFVAIGAFALCWSIVVNAGLASVGGIVSSVLFLPAMQMARRIREQNIALRMLEVPLDRAQTAEEASQLLRDFFARAFDMGKINSGPK
jgi:hypothetical protein